MRRNRGSCRIRVRRSGGQLAGLAAQFELAVPGVSGGTDLEFYGELIKSREFLDELGFSEYRVAGGSERSDSVVASLVDLYDIDGATRVGGFIY